MCTGNLPGTHEKEDHHDKSCDNDVQVSDDIADTDLYILQFPLFHCRMTSRNSGSVVCRMYRCFDISSVGYDHFI